MRAEIINVGTELLLGAILNTNQQFLLKKCAELGIDVHRTTVIGDNASRISEAASEALLRADLVILTGGLGPTADDVTLSAAARAFGWKLVRHQPTHRSILGFVRIKNRAMTPQISAQALVPAGARVFANIFGTSPGILAVASPGKYVLLLPGPPREMNPMVERLVAPALAALYGKSVKSLFLTRALKFSGIPEADIAACVDDLLRMSPPVTLGIYARAAEVELRIMSKAARRTAAAAGIARVEKDIRRRFSGETILVDDETLEGRLGEILRASGKTVACAESCTGGLVGSLLTNVPGSSDYFLGSAVCYANRIKESVLGVLPATLARSGAVSVQTAREMALGAQKLFGSDWAVSITGIAGPTALKTKKPVGLVYIAVAGPGRCVAYRHHFLGGREDVKIKAAKAALLALVRSAQKCRNEADEDLGGDICV